MAGLKSWSGVLLAVAMLTGCAGSGPSPEQQAAQAKAQETLDQILAAPLSSEEYSKTERCISTFEYDTMEVLDDQHVIFEGRGDRVWLNTLRNRCIGLRRDSVPVIRLRDSQLCDLDTFQARDSMLGVWTRTSATCSLGTFSRITPEQADTIRAAFKEARKQR